MIGASVLLVLLLSTQPVLASAMTQSVQSCSVPEDTCIRIPELQCKPHPPPLRPPPPRLPPLHPPPSPPPAPPPPSSMCNGNSLECDTCNCLFKHCNCPQDHPEQCMNVTLRLGLCCGNTSDPIEYITSTISNFTNVDSSNDKCLLGQFCFCLSRENNHVDLEDTCRLLCMSPNSTDKSMPVAGVLNGNNTVCDPVHRQFCRRHMEPGRPTKCAQMCVQDGSCETLIEGILEENFEGSDVDAVLSVLKEFRLNGGYPQHVNKIIRTSRSFFEAIDRKEETTIAHFNRTNSMDLMSLFDDILSDERQQQRDETKKEDESYGQELLERIETTIALLGMSHQQRRADLEFENFEYEGSNIVMNVECLNLSETGYEHIFHNDLGEAILFLPPEPTSDTDNDCRRSISGVLSSNLGDFVSNSSDNSTQVDSDIMTVQMVETEGAAHPLSNITITFSSLKTGDEYSNPTCVFWDTTLKDWATEGVVMMMENSTHYMCQSEHLTSFAVLVSVRPVQISAAEAMALNIVGYIGCAISIVCLLLTLFWLVALRKVLNKGVLLYIHFNLFLSLLLALLVFVAGIETATQIEWLCTTVAIVLHYLFLCVFCWMLAEGIMLYILVVRMFSNASDKWYYLLPLGWGVPIPIVAVSAGIRHEFYGNDMFCWLSMERGTHWSFIGPMIAIMLMNSVILVLTVGSIVRVKRKSGREKDRKNLPLVITSVKSTVVLLPLLGVTWIIGLFAVNQNTSVFAWLFTILNSLQGILIFSFHILRNKKVRIKMLEKCGQPSRKHSIVSISTEVPSTSTLRRDSEPQNQSNRGQIKNDLHFERGIEGAGVNHSFRVTLTESTSSDSHEYQTSVIVCKERNGM